MCNSGGFHVYKKVNVDGFFFKDKTLLSLRDSSAKVYLRLGYKYIEAQGEEPEGRHRNVQLYRYSMSHKGEITRNVVSDLNSDYAVGFVDPFPVSDYINERRYEVRNRATGELLGMSNRFDTRGGWLMNWLLDTLLSNNIAGTVSVCPETYPDVIPLVIPPIGFSGVEK
jgi:hypothetical protein